MDGDRRGAGDPRAALEQTLGGPLPPGVRELDDAALEQLARVVAQARRRQAAEIAAAGDRALRFVPRLLRGPIKKVVS